MEFRKFLIVASLCAYAIPAMMGCAAKKTEEVDDSSETPTTAPVSSVALSASSTSQTVSTCFAITATAIGSSGSAVSADANAAFTLAKTAGTGTFYTDSGCTSSTTSGTISSGSSTLALYFKSTTIEAETLQATFNSTAGTAWSGTIYGPNPTAIQMASTVHGTCVPVSVYYKNGSSTYTLPYNSTVTLTQTSGATVSCYDTVGCTGANYTTGSVTTYAVASGTIGATLYCSQATATQTFIFTGAWAYTQNGITTSGTNSVSYQNW